MNEITAEKKKWTRFSIREDVAIEHGCRLYILSLNANEFKLKGSLTNTPFE